MKHLINWLIVVSLFTLGAYLSTLLFNVTMNFPFIIGFAVGTGLYAICELEKKLPWTFLVVTASQLNT
jgi:hypothetical protein